MRLDHMRDGVEKAIERLGAGFISHPGNGALRERLRSGELDAQDYYRQLLRVVYRILFLLVAEERGLLHPPDTTAVARQRYDDHYSITRLRRLAEQRRGTAHSDRWENIKVVTAALGGTDGLPALGLPALGSMLWSVDSTADLSGAQLSNADLFAAMRNLALVEDSDSGRSRRIDYRNMGTEELGSVYENLLELEPVIHLDGGRFELAGTGEERRDTGAHYTPPTILAKVLDFALDPQIAERLRQADPEAALLDLRVLDPAVGSGHFLIAAGHRIARALAQVRTGEQEPSPEVQRQAFRDVVARCLYGVDVNPMAVELAKVALWLEALDPGKPLSFLDHRIRCGNSLLGVPLGTTVARNRSAIEEMKGRLEGEIKQLRAILKEATGDDAQEIQQRLDAAGTELARARYDSWADSIPDDAFKKLEDDVSSICTSARQANARERRGGLTQLGFGGIELELPPDRALALADAWIAAWFWPKDRPDPQVPTHGLLEALRLGTGSLTPEQARQVTELKGSYRFLHYELAYPEVFESTRGGFDAVIGNPPYLGGSSISRTMGARALHFLKANTPESGARTDLAVYFLRRAFDLLRPQGSLCFITTNSIAETNNASAGLEVMLSWGGSIIDALSTQSWDGDADVAVVVVHIRRDASPPKRTLDGEDVDFISARLRPRKEIEPTPLPSNDGGCHGFNITPLRPYFIDGLQRREIADTAPQELECLRPLINAKMLMSFSNGEQERPRETAEATGGESTWLVDISLPTEVEAQREYPVLMQVLRKQVASRRGRWWSAGHPPTWWRDVTKGTGDHVLTRGMSSFVTMPRHSKFMLPEIIDSGWAPTNSLRVFPWDPRDMFALLTSQFHWLWAARWCSTLGTSPRYVIEKCFGTFPRPDLTDQVGERGSALLMLRHSIQTDRQLGMTSLYNLVIDPDCDDDEILQIRSAHVALDEAVARAYGWEDLIDRFDHGHHPTERFGVWWTVKPETQREIGQRLLELNLERAAAETE